MNGPGTATFPLRTNDTLHVPPPLGSLCRTCGLFLLVALVSPPSPAQNISSPPVPEEIPTLTEQPLDAPPATATRLPAGRDQRETDATPGMTPWDLYAGSVYANTSPLWFHAEGLLWWMGGNELPALVTTSPNGTLPGDAGVLGAADTSILHGDRRVDDSLRGGFRSSLGIRLGHWFDDLMDSELQFDVLWVGDGQSSGDFAAASLGSPILARPYHDVSADSPAAELVAFPNEVQGSISIETTSDFLSTGALFRQAWGSWGATRVDWLAGYRYAQFEEDLSIHEQYLTLEAEPTVVERSDRFRTWNEFHGADIGLQVWTRAGGWTVEILTKLALGAVVRTVEIDGETFTDPSSDPATVSEGGLVAMPTNMGRFQSSQFSVMPELTIRFRRPISRFFTFTVGYTALALNNTARTGEQIDLAVNTTQFAGGTLNGAPRPAMSMNDSTLWVQGLSVGLEW